MYKNDGVTRRYSKKRDKSSKSSERTSDYFLSKIDSMMNMIRLAIAN